VGQCALQTVVNSTSNTKTQKEGINDSLFLFALHLGKLNLLIRHSEVLEVVKRKTRDLTALPENLSVYTYF